MALCGACCAGDGGELVLAPVEAKPAGVGFDVPLDKALGGPGSMREQAVADSKQRQEEPKPVEVPMSIPKAAPLASAAAVATNVEEVKIRPSAVFNVQIPKGDRKMCIDINFHDHKTLLLTKVNAGPVEDFNRANPASEVAPGDRIEVVNGAQGDTQSMLDACRSATTLDLRVARCEEKTITLRKGVGNRKLGLTWQIIDGMTLIVTKIDEESLLSEHNRAHPDHDVDLEDRIIGVNGVRSNSAKLDEALRESDTYEWDLTVRRIWPDAEE